SHDEDVVEDVTVAYGARDLDLAARTEREDASTCARFADSARVDEEARGPDDAAVDEGARADLAHRVPSARARYVTIGAPSSVDAITSRPSIVSAAYRRSCSLTWAWTTRRSNVPRTSRSRAVAAQMRPRPSRRTRC